MKHPGTTECDLCHNPIPRGVKHAAIAIPLSKNDKAEIRAELQRDLPKEAMPNMMFGPFTPDSLVPEVWQFETCMDCIGGILPMLSTLKTDQIRHILREKAAARERAKQQEEEQEA